MISMALTQQMGTPPVAASRRGSVPVVGAVSFCSARRRAAALRPYAGIPASGFDRNGNGVLVSGFWAAGSMVATTHTIKRPTRPLARRKT